MAQRPLLLSVSVGSVPVGKWRNRAELGVWHHTGPGMVQRLSSPQRLHGKSREEKVGLFAGLKTEVFQVVVQG